MMEIPALISEAVVLRYSAKKMSLKILQNSQETTRRRALVCRHQSATLFKKRLWHRFFHTSFAKFLKTLILQNTSGRLLLHAGKNMFKINKRATKTNFRVSLGMNRSVRPKN